MRMLPFGPWQRWLHEMNLDWLVDWIKDVSGAVDGKQDKLTAGANITIDENNVISSTGSGGGTTYTAGDGITIQNNVISVTNPVNKLHITLENMTLPCLKLTSSGIVKQDGTDATLSDFIDLGASNANLADYFFMKGQILGASGVYANYDYMTQSYTDIEFSNVDIYSNVSSVYLGQEVSVLDMFDSYVSTNINFVIYNGETPVYPNCYIVIGKKNGHLYFGELAQAFGADSPYMKSLHDDFTWDFIAF